MLDAFKRMFEIRHKWARRTQAEVYSLLSSHRYLVHLSPCEGLGLVPIEAMAGGAVVAGFDGMGGNLYFKPGINSVVAGYPMWKEAVDKFAQVVKDKKMAVSIVEKGRETAQKFDYSNFEVNWKRYFENNFFAR